jgi:hypothetical protein
MISSAWRRTAVTVVVLAGIAVALGSIVFRWRPPLWVLILGGVIVIAVIVGLLVSPRRRGGSAELYASDEYSDIQLGRRHPTHPHQGVAESSQIADDLPVDPLVLPPLRTDHLDRRVTE